MMISRVRKLQQALDERRGWLLLREQRIQQVEKEIEQAQAIVREREDRLLVRDERIKELEEEIERVQALVREREEMICAREETIRSLEHQVARLKNPRDEGPLRLEIDRRGATVREREARILSLETELEGRNSELHLLRTALDQAQDVLRKRDARLVFLEQQPEMLSGALPEAPDIRADQEKPGNESSPAAILHEWQQAAVEFTNNSALRGGQELIDPYIVEKNIYGSLTRLLIATRQSQKWYDSFDLTEAPFIDSLRMVRGGDTVFDCGAHQGVHSLLYSRMVGPGGRVVAFDPFPMNLKIARLNARLNDRSNIDFIGVALSNAAGQSNASVAEQCIILDNQDADDVVPLKLTTLDEFAELEPDFIKIDIEGAEIDALEGARKILSRKPCLYIEMHPGFLPRFGKTMMDVFRMIDLGEYHCFVNYPGKEPLLKYRREFDVTLPCAFFFVPRSRPPLLRYYTIG